MSYFHQPVTGEIGKHLPKEMVRIERDWSGGEMCQCVHSPVLGNITRRELGKGADERAKLALNWRLDSFFIYL